MNADLGLVEMYERSITLEGVFDVIGRLSEHKNRCFFDVTSDCDYDLMLFTNNTCIHNASDIDKIRYGVKPAIGFLRDGEKTYTNTKLVFIKRNEPTSSFGDVISETCYTDKGGMYKAYIQPGIYDIEIYINNKKIVKRHQNILEGLKYPYYQMVSGMIYSKYKDTVSFCGTDYKNIYGILVDNKGTHLAQAEMIVLQNGEIKAYVHTDDDGKYSFALTNGVYDVKIRANKSPLKTTTVTLDDTHGFTEQLLANNIMWNKEDVIKI